MNDRELKQAIESLAAGTDPGRVRDGVRAEIECDAQTKRRQYTGKEFFGMKKRKWTAVLAAAALVTVLTAAVAAAPAILNYLNARAVQRDSVSRLEEVPEGWIGVYTIDDLDAIREDLGANYILMADLAFEDGDFEEGGRFPGGWTPIGKYNDPFFGIFNGNGHTVNGLVIRASAEDVFDAGNATCGLFGCAKLSEYFVTETYVQHMPEDGTGVYEIDINGDGIPEAVDENGIIIREGQTVTHTIFDPTKERKLWGGGGIVKNLRLTNGTMEIEYAPVRTVVDEATGAEAFRAVNLWAGPVAGYADHVLGCVVEDFSVEITGAGSAEVMRAYAADREAQGLPILDEEPRRGLGRSMIVGGVAGEAYQIDSCAADTAITVRAGEASSVSRPFVGGLGGVLSACVTSYFDGTISGDAGDCGIGYIRKDDVPRLLSADVMDEIAIRTAYLWTLTNETNSTGDRLYGAAEDYEAKTEALRKAGVTAATLNEYLSENDPQADGWLANKLMAFYSFYTGTVGMGNGPAVDLDMAQSLYTDDLTDVTFYVLDPETKSREYRELSKIISAAFPDGDFEDFCRENHVKYGAYYAYDLRADPECAFDGFDFGVIWTRGEDGLPVPRLFG